MIIYTFLKNDFEELHTGCIIVLFFPLLTFALLPFLYSSCCSSTCIFFFFSFYEFTTLKTNSTAATVLQRDAVLFKNVTVC